MSSPSIPELRAQAREMSRPENGLSYNQALHRLARASGYRSWGALLAAQTSAAPTEPGLPAGRLWARLQQTCLAHWLREQAGEDSPTEPGEATLIIAPQLTARWQTQAEAALQAEREERLPRPVLNARITRSAPPSANPASLSAEERAWLRAGGKLQSLTSRPWTLPVTREEARLTPPGSWTITQLPPRVWRQFKADLPPT